MYVSILTLRTGWAIAAGSLRLGIYTVILGIAFHLRVLLFEEPRLAKLFADDWIAYKGSVGRWLARLRR